MKRFLFTAALVLSLLIINAQYVYVDDKTTDSGDVTSLKATHQKYLKAWSDRDIDTIVEIGTGAVGFGHSTAFPRPIRIRDTFRKQVQQFYDMMEIFTIKILTENYHVVGDTGLAWGHYACTTKQKDGPQRTIYLRYAHTFAKRDGKWRLVMYHRSLMTSEDMQ
ncbi:YybH family protein [Candidatus Latescibacterota bacterium]